MLYLQPNPKHKDFINMAVKNWIAGAIKKPGALHRALKVPMDEKIPEAKLAKAAKSPSPLMRKRVGLAKTLRSF